MPAYMIKALFVLTGALLLHQLRQISRRAGAAWVRGLTCGVSGVCALLTGNTLGGVFGLGIGLNALTLPVAAGLGVPGVAVLWALKYLL